MAYPKNSTSHYRNFGGINEKASEYTTQNSQALNLRNIDFYVPNSWGKTPGSTQAITNGTSGTIRSLFEFEKLSGASFIIAGSNNEVLINNGVTGWSSISTGWTNGQPEDILAFVDKAWIANGQYMISFDGTSVQDFGLPCPPGGPLGNSSLVNAVSTITVFGATLTSAASGFSKLAFAYAAYRYVRSDGYYGPLKMTENAGVITPYVIGISPADWQGITGGNYGGNVTLSIKGFTSPSGNGATAIALYLALDAYDRGQEPELGSQYANQNFGSPTISPTADFSKFKFVTLLPLATTDIFLSGINDWTASVEGNASFSGMIHCFFETYTPRFIELNNNQLFMAGFSAAPSTTWFSETGEPEVILENSFFETRTNDGDVITGIKQFQNQLVIFKQRSFHKLIGSQESNYQLVEITTEYGCLSNKAIVEFNNRLLFLDKEGVVEFNGASWNVISTAVEDTFRTMNISAALHKAVAVHYIERNQVWFGIPVGASTENNLTVVYDYLLDAWTFIEGFNPSAFAPMKQGLSKRTVWYGDYSGSINYMSPSFFSYDGRAFTSVIETGFDSPDGQDVTNIFRRLFLDVNTQSGVTGVINVEVFADYNRSSAQATFAVYQDQFQTRADFGVQGKAVAFKMSHSNVSLPLLINGYDVQRRYLRKV